MGVICKIEDFDTETGKKKKHKTKRKKRKKNHDLIAVANKRMAAP